MQVNIDTALVRDAVEKLVKQALAEVDNMESELGGVARDALKSCAIQSVRESIHAAHVSICAAPSKHGGAK